MTNNYTFNCPVTGDDATISYCEGVHKNGMQGKPHETENKLCGLAHLCYMCPFRNAVCVGGPWSKPENMPFAEEKPDKAAKLPRDLIVYALAHTKPKGTDYRRVGLRGDNVGIHDEHFVKLQQSVLADPSKVARPSAPAKQTPRKGSTKSAAKSEPSRPKTTLDALDAQQNDMADAVNELVQKEKAANKAPQSVEKPTATHDKQKSEKKPQQARSGVSDAPSKPLTLAERAKLMKSRKTS